MPATWTAPCALAFLNLGAFLLTDPLAGVAPIGGRPPLPCRFVTVNAWAEGRAMLVGAAVVLGVLTAFTVGMVTARRSALVTTGG